MAASLAGLLWVVGLATYYDPGVMDAVVDYRVSIGQLARCAECVGYVALLEPEQIGRRVWLQAPGRAVEGPFLVVDCAQPGHRDYLRSRGWAVDVDWETAQRWGMNGPLAGVQVLDENRMRNAEGSMTGDKALLAAGRRGGGE